MPPSISEKSFDPYSKRNFLDYVAPDSEVNLDGNSFKDDADKIAEMVRAAENDILNGR